MSRVHVVLTTAGGGEYSACGYAFDAFASEGVEEAEGRFEWARPGLRVTCPECCNVVRQLRRSVRGLVLTIPKST